MELKALKKAIHDAAMAVRRGDWSQYDRLQDLRKQHRAASGVPEAAPAEAAPAAAPKKSKKSRKTESTAE